MAVTNAAPASQEIAAALRELAVDWAAYAGTERSEAQSFLNALLTCYGTDRRAVGAVFEHHLPGIGFADLFWPGNTVIEMKAPSEDVRLEKWQVQAEKYWRASASPDGSYTAVRYVVLCSFRRFVVWDMHADPSRPAANVELEQLPERPEALLFLRGPEIAPSFVEHHRQLTTDAAAAVAAVYQSLKDRAAAPLDEIQRFTIQSVWVLFAEDLAMITGYPFQSLIDRLRKDEDRNSAAEIGLLFRVLNQKGNHNRKGVLAGTRYVNGDLFREPAEVSLEQSELTLLARAAEYDWRLVDPTIFGSLLEGVLGRERRWELGAHYTHEVDILKIVGPTIVAPWQARIDGCVSPGQARELLDELCAFTVLDPACGCGNFLYVAYRELRALEAQLKTRIRTLAADRGLSVPPGPWPFVPLSNMRGLEIERAAVLIARVTLWMGHRQMIELYGEAEDPLPLVDLSGIRVADALRTTWPAAEAIVGNPPFLGSQHIRARFGGDYVDWLSRTFGVGVKDYCTYWFRLAHDHLQPGQRAGLVGTNSISQNRARSASLAYITGNGGTITDAVSSQVWPGDAKVHVSLVNWVLGDPTGPVVLDGNPVPAIDASLRPADPAAIAAFRLPANRGHCFQGPIPVGAGFVLDAETARDLLSDSTIEYRSVVRPYLTAADVTDDPEQRPSRWIIDFAQLPLERAAAFPRALAIVNDEVRPFRLTVRREVHRRRWWQFGEPRVGLRAAVADLSRSIVVAAHGKRVLFAWIEPWTLPSNATMVFAFDDDYSMGVLTSRAHGAWARSASSTIKADFRYTPTSVFETFVWPDSVADDVRTTVADAARLLLTRRAAICASGEIGLTTLYNRVDDGAHLDLVVLHRRLDEAVARAYGWPKAVAQDDAELVRRLLALNAEVASGRRSYAPFPPA